MCSPSFRINSSGASWTTSWPTSLLRDIIAGTRKRASYRSFASAGSKPTQHPGMQRASTVASLCYECRRGDEGQRLADIMTEMLPVAILGTGMAAFGAVHHLASEGVP